MIQHKITPIPISEVKRIILKSILSVLFISLSLVSVAQFKIVYKNEYFDSETHEKLDFGYGVYPTYEEYYIMDGHYKGYSDGGQVWAHYYKAGTNRLYYISPTQQVEFQDVTEGNSEITITKTDSVINILGYECIGYDLTIDGSRFTYFTTPKLSYDPESFSNHKLMGFNESTRTIGGQGSLRHIGYLEDMYIVSTAIEIEELDMQPEDFDYKKDSKAKLKALKQEYEGLLSEQKKLVKNDVDKNSFHVYGQVSGVANMANLKIPVEMIADEKDYQMMKMSVFNVVFLQAHNPEYDWEYNGAESYLEKAESGEMDLQMDFLLMLRDFYKAKKEPDVLLDSRKIKLEDTDYLKLFMASEDSSLTTLLLDPEKYHIFMIDRGDEYLTLENYRQFDGIWMPTRIDISSEEFIMTIDSMRFIDNMDRSQFFIPDSLESIVVERKYEMTADDYYNEGENYLNEDNYEAAIESYAKAINLDPNNYLYFNQSGMAKLNNNDVYGAISDFNRSVTLKPDYVTGRHNLGYTKLQLNDYKNALEDYNIAIELDSTEAYLFSYRGNAHYQLKEYEKALYDFKRALELDSSRYVDAFNTAYTLSNLLEKPEESIPYYNQAIEGDYKKSSTINHRGVAYFHMEDWEKALEDFKLSIKLDDNPSSVKYNNLGNTYREMSEYKDAINAYQKASKADTTNSSVINRIGLCHFDLEEYEEAITYFTKAIGVDNTEATYFDNRGESKERIMDYQGAVEDYNESLNLYANDPEIFFRRGRAKVNLNNNYDACLDFKKAKELGRENMDEIIKEYCLD